MNDRAAVSIQGVSKHFKAGVTALSGIDLDVRPQELISLIGPSGCGKSTLLRIIGDLIDPSEGVVEVNGKPASQARRDHDYGIVFQEAVLYDWRTVSKNIALPLELLRWSREKRTQRVNEMLRLVELEGFEERFGALDEMTRERLNMELLRIWEASGSTIVFVTHSIAEAVFLSTRVVVMSPRPGQIADLVDVDLPYPRTAETREEPRFFELVTGVRERLAGRGAQVEPELLEDAT